MNNVKKNLIGMMIPAFFGLLMTFLFQLVDAYFIGKLGAGPLAAVGFTFPLYIAIINVFMGLSIGIGAKVGQSYGRKGKEEISRYATSGLYITILLSVFFIALVYKFRFDFYTLLGASDATSVLIDDYMATLLLGMPFILLSMNMIASLRGIGKGLLPEMVMAGGGILNLVLDYVLIFGLGPIAPMGIKGAALATVISWAFIFVVILVTIINNGLLVLKVRQMIGATKDILIIAFPAMINNLIVPMTIMVVTRLISNQSELSVAAYSIASKVESLFLALIMALSMVLVPLMAQSYGAENKKDMDRVVSVAGKISVYWSIGLYILIVVFSNKIAGLFTSDAKLIVLISRYLLIVGLSYAFLSITTITLSLFNAVGESKQSLMITLIKNIVVFLPAVFLAAKFSLTAILVAISLSNIIGGILASVIFKRWLETNHSELAGVSISLEYLKDFRQIIRKKSK